MTTPKRIMSDDERAIRIELAQARAALERRRLRRSGCRLADDLQPSNLARSLMPQFGGGGGSSFSLSDLVGRAVRLTQRYPMLLSGVSSLVPILGRRSRLMRLAGGVLLAWKFLKGRKA